MRPRCQLSQQNTKELHGHSHGSTYGAYTNCCTLPTVAALAPAPAAALELPGLTVVAAVAPAPGAAKRGARAADGGPGAGCGGICNAGMVDGRPHRGLAGSAADGLLASPPTTAALVGGWSTSAAAWG